MATVDEILAAMPDVEAAGATNEVLVIDPNTRQISIPGSELIFGVEGDAGSERKYFLCSRYIGNNIDLASCFLRVNYRNANGVVDEYLVEDVTANGDNITFSWEVSPKAVEYKGQVTFLVCAIGPNLKLAWHTTVASGIVLEGMEPDNSHVESETTDVVAQLVAMMEAQTAAVEAEGAKQIKAVQTAAEVAEAASVAEIEAKGVNTRASIPDDYTALSEAVSGLTKGRAGAIVCEVEGSAVAVNDASDLPMQGLKIFGRSTQDGVPTPDAPVEIVSVENPTISVNEQTLNIPRTLPGIPVTSGGNYTDSDGQQWICDEVDFERGVYVQRTQRRTISDFSGAVTAEPTNGHTEGYFNLKVHSLEKTGGYCDRFPYSASGYFPRFGLAGAMIYFTLAGEYTTEEWRNQMAALSPTVVTALKNPIETPLSETELAAYRALHSNKPNTTVLNDAGAHMAVAYAADTKLYIDNKIAAPVGG